jgi:hypothetical protein
MVKGGVGQSSFDARKSYENGQSFIHKSGLRSYKTTSESTTDRIFGPPLRTSSSSGFHTERKSIMDYFSPSQDIVPKRRNNGLEEIAKQREAAQTHRDNIRSEWQDKVKSEGRRLCQDDVERYRKTIADSPHVTGPLRSWDEHHPENHVNVKQVPPRKIYNQKDRPYGQYKII